MIRRWKPLASLARSMNRRELLLRLVALNSSAALLCCRSHVQVVQSAVTPRPPPLPPATPTEAARPERHPSAPRSPPQHEQPSERNVRSDPTDLRYSKDHEWVSLKGTMAVVGITAFAVDNLGDITAVELPKVGGVVRQGDAIATIESVKAVSDIYAPLSGTIMEVNDGLTISPEVIGDDCYGDGWLFRLRCTNVHEQRSLMNARAYAAYTKEIM